GGVATTTSAGSGPPLPSGSPAPMSRASARAEGEVSARITVTPRRRSPSAVLVPSRPVPTTLTGPVVRGAACLLTLVLPPRGGPSLAAPGTAYPRPSQVDARHERAELGALDHPGVSGLEPSEADVPEPGPHQPGDRVADLLEHAAHDPVAALVQLDLGAQPPGEGTGHLPLDGGDVGLGHLVGGVGEPVGELAVVGEQEEALGLLVEPAHVEEPLGPVGDVLGQVGAALLVLHRRDDTGRLVQGEGHLGLVELEPDTVDVDDGGGRVDPGAELDHPAVHRDTAVDDELLAGAPRPVAGSGQDLLQS